jgi:hypothetical protein
MLATIVQLMGVTAQLVAKLDRRALGLF